jgi:hypothetical protein
MAVLLAGGGGAYWATASSGGGARSSSGSSGNDSSPSPLPLDLGGVNTGGANLATPAAGVLPDGPGSAAVLKPGSVSRAAAEKLAKALGVPGGVRSVGGYWKAGGGTGPTLQVLKDAPGTWSYAAEGIAPLKDYGSVVSERKALAVAKPLLAALGLGDAAVDASEAVGEVRVVNADPVVAGLPTYGWRTSLRVRADGVVGTALGRLSPLARGATYPVVTAARALKELRGTGGTGGDYGIGACPTIQPKESKSPGDDPVLPSIMPCVPTKTQPLQVRTAVFGLSSQLVASRPTLVPSWLFEVAQAGVRKTSTLAQPAVDPAYVKKASTPSASPTPTATTAPGTRRMKISSYSVSGKSPKSLELHFWGGVCNPYSASADASGTEVMVQVTYEREDPGKVCIAMAKYFTETVSLDRVLGNRKVIDLSDGTTVPKEK